MPAKGSRIGILGGTFDPIHFGHLLVGEWAREAFELSQVVFVPAGQPPHKQGEGRLLTTPRFRRDMLLLAIHDHPHFRLWNYELYKEGPSYTMETMNVLLERLPDYSFYFIMGKDTLEDIFSWKTPRDFLQSCDIIVCSRGDHPGTVIERVHRKVPDARLHPLQIPVLAISSSEIRHRVHQGRSIRYLTPNSVVEYIKKTELYIGGRREG